MTMTMTTMARDGQWHEGILDDGDDDGDGQDENDTTTMMATAHQAGYYALFILNWKNTWRRRNGRRQ